MSPRLGYTAFPYSLALLVLLCGCGAPNASLPFAPVNANSAQPHHHGGNLTSFTAQLYGNEAKPYTGSPGTHSAFRLPHRRHPSLKHGVPGI